MLQDLDEELPSSEHYDTTIIVKDFEAFVPVFKDESLKKEQDVPVVGRIRKIKMQIG